MKRSGLIRKSLGLILLVTIYMAGAAAQADQAQFIYDELGRLQAVVDAQGNAAIYSYDAVGNLLSITRRSAGQVTILSIEPSKGPVGTTVTITGIGFSATPSSNQVTFGGGATAIVQSFTTTSILTTVPDGAVTSPITVTTSTGSATSTQQFVVLPAIASMSPSFGFQGSTITTFSITGTSLQGSTSVQFIPSDGITVANPPVVSSDGKAATVSVTIGATAPLGLRVVTITNPDGTTSATASSQNSFTVLPNEPIPVNSAAIQIFVQSPPAVAGSEQQLGVFVEPTPDQVIAPYVGVQVSP